MGQSAVNPITPGPGMLRSRRMSVMQVLVVVWLSLAVGGLLLSTINWLQLSAQLRSAEQHFRIHQEATHILNHLLEAELSCRSFLLTEQEQEKASFGQHRTRLREHFDTLVEQISGRHGMLGQVMELRAGLALVMDHFDDFVERVGAGELEEAVSGLEDPGAKQRLSSVRHEIEQIAAESQESAKQAEGRTLKQLKRAGATTVVIGILGIGAGILALWTSLQTLRHQQREQELIKARREAEHDSEEKTAFLANMSHEIRTPLNAILGFSELLQNEVQDSRQKQFLRSIRTSSKTLLQLINDILDISKIEAGVLSLHPEPTSPREVCEFAQAVFSEIAARKGIELECVVAEEVPPSLVLDRIRLRQILVNLVGNAVKFTDQGKVTLRVEGGIDETDPQHANLLIQVRDTGIGIPSDRLQRIFLPFEQAGADQDKEEQGTGLGLAIVKRLTEAMGGTVTAESVAGKGTTFRLRFSRCKTSVRIPVTDRPEQAHALELNDLEPARILIADDNTENRELLAQMLEQSHHTCAFASDGREAVEQTKAFRPNLILMDVRMPVMDGRQAMLEIKQNPGLELLPVIAVTASSSRPQDQQLLKAFDGHLQKPFTQDDLVQILSLFLRRQKADEEAAACSPQGCQPIEASPQEARPGTAGPAPDGLVGRLEELCSRDWPELNDTPGFRACAAFAENLMVIAQQWEYQPLLDYARRLQESARAYDMERLEELLGQFPHLCEEAKATPASPST